MRYIIVILLFWVGKAHAISTPAQMLRACINNDDSSITVFWNNPSDLCGSFNVNHLYASEDNGPFELIARITDYSINQYSFKLSDLNDNFRFKINTLNTCDGADSVQSSILAVDITRPNQIQLDSVSYDLNSQHIIAGWTQNPSPDTKEYDIYDYSSGDGDSIGTTNQTFYTVSTDPNRRFPVVIATLDSCNLSSLLSSPHKVMYLTSNIDTCLNEITLNWTSYIGWSSIDSQSLFVSINHGPFTKHITIPATANNLVFNNFTLGDTIEFYVRAHHNDITSSSNKTQIETRERIIPTVFHLDYVSVVSDIQVFLEWNVNSNRDLKHYQILRSRDGVAFSVIHQLDNSTFTYTDNSANTQSTSYYYKVRSTNHCDEVQDSTSIARTILLQKDASDILTHNPYENWEIGVEEYILEYNNGSTWNSVLNSTTPIVYNESTTGCYRVTAKEVINSLGYSSTSLSNVLCVQDSLELYITTAINPNSANNRFIIQGLGIDTLTSYYEIYNRWGELIVRNPVNIPWYATVKTKPIMPGMYIYIAKVNGVLGEQLTKKGTINVLR